MATTLELDKMTVAEKLAAMELLWEDLSRDPAAIPSPAWHGEVLAERMKNRAAGKLPCHDLKTSKERVR